MKLSRMAIDPRKPRKFNPANVKAYTVPAAQPHNLDHLETSGGGEMFPNSGVEI